MTADPLARIAIVGTSGSGKTTLARQLAARVGAPHLELDRVYWGPRWTPSEPEAFRAKVTDVIRPARWVLDGNYGEVRDLVWRRATMVVWLDYPLRLVLWRVVRRTVRRSLRREELWHGNRETLRQGFLSRDSIILWSLRTYHRRRREYPALLRRPEYAHLAVVHLRSPVETERWLARLG